MNMARMEMAPEWLSAVIAWPALAGQLLAFGSAVLALGLIPRRSPDPLIEQRIEEAMAPLWRICAIVNLLFFGIMIVAKTAGMAGVSWMEALPLIGEVMKETHAGHVWEWQALASAAFVAVTVLPLKIRWRVSIVPALAAILLLADSLTSHAIDYGTAAIAIDFAHELAGGIWAGALLGYWLVARADHDAGSRIAAATVLSRLALGAVAVLVLSGTYLGWRTIGFSAHELMHATYSHVLTVKLVFFAAALTIGAGNRLWLMPNLQLDSVRVKLVRNVALETIILISVIGIAAVLANTSPARM
jgi:copper resistance protein D